LNEPRISPQAKDENKKLNKSPSQTSHPVYIEDATLSP